MNRALGTQPAFGTPERALRRVGKYRILSELGRGGMANVYLAVVHGLGGVDKLVVLKALLPELSTDPDALAMFLDEARLAARLNHANVVQTYEVGIEDDRQVIVMEFLDGQSLSSVLKQAELAGQPISLAMQLRIIISALEGLHYAHELCDYDGSSLGLVHRDISPQNIFVTYDGQVKVLDFGIAKATTSSTNTATGIVKGKIAYMSPEQMIGDAIDRRADVYSVGCMLWMAGTGKKLWRDTPDVQVMRRVINNETPTPQSANPSCDNELNRIAIKALASEPNERYGTVQELQADLEAYCESFSVPIKQREIGKYVSTLFADTRAELKGLVDRQLTLVTTSNSKGGSEGSSSAVHDARALWLEENSADPVEVPSEPQSAKRRLTLALVGIGIAASVFAGILAWRALRPPLPSAQLAAPPPAPTVAAPARIGQPGVSLAAQPAHDAVAHDGSEVVANPSATAAPAPGRAQPVRAAASKRPASSVSKRPTKSENSNANSATSNKSACAQPFMIDAHGIKKLRPECL